MSTQITDYGTLKTAIFRFLAKNTELKDMIPLFIGIAERWIFRKLRLPAHETLFDWEQLGPTDLPYQILELPGDFLELKFLLAGDKPLTRKSDIWIKQKLNSNPISRTPDYFARIGNRIYLWPVPNDPLLTFSMSYWADYSGTLVDDTDTHDVLRIAPDIFLYGALLQAAPYLIDDERVPVWKDLFMTGLGLLTEQKDEAEYAGSPVAVSSVGGDSL